MKKIAAMITTTAMILGMLPANVFAQESNTIALGFPDMPNNYATAALEKAVKNGLLAGAEGKINPQRNVTRAEMATIITRAFGSTEKAILKGYSDVNTEQWFYDAMAKAVQMGVIKGDGNRLKPDDNITREQAFTVIARAMQLGGAKTSNIQFEDLKTVSSWATEDVNGLINAGYIQGDGIHLRPKEPITRQDFAVIFDSVIKEYITKAGVVTSVTGGNIVVNVPDVTIKDVTIDGNLILGDGIGNGDVSLDNVKVMGKMVVRGGGVESVKVKGNFQIPEIVISRMDGPVRVVNTGAAKIDNVVVVGGKDDVVVEGIFGAATINTETPITFKNAAVQTITTASDKARVTVDVTSKAETVTVLGESSEISVVGTVTTVATTAKETTVNVSGTVTNLAATKGATGANLNVGATGTATNITTAAPNTTVSNNGTVGTLSSTKDATEGKLVVGEKSTIGKVVSENKSNLTVTTAAAEAAAKAAAEAKKLAEKAQEDKLAAEKALAQAKTAEQKAKAEAAQKAAAEAAAKADAEKSAADKAVEDAKKDEQQTIKDTENITEEKPVAPPQEKPDGGVSVPPVPPVTPPPSGGGGGGGGGGGTTPTLSVSELKVVNATTVTFKSAGTPTAITWNNVAIGAMPTAVNSVYTITVPIMKASNTILVSASGYLQGSATVAAGTTLSNAKVTFDPTEFTEVSFDIGAGFTFDGYAEGADNAEAIGALYMALATAKGDQARYDAAKAVGNDVIVTYYYMNNGEKVYLQTAGGNPLVKNKLWGGYLWYNNGEEYQRLETASGQEGTYLGIKLLDNKSWLTSTNSHTGAVIAAWLLPVLGKDLCVDVMVIKDGVISEATATVAIPMPEVSIEVSTKDALIAAVARGSTTENVTIVMAEGTYSLNAPLAITKNITLKGAGKEKTSIEPQDGVHAISISDGVTLNLADLQIKVGGAGRGINSVNSSGDLSNTVMNLQNTKIDYPQTGRGIALGGNGNTTNNHLKLMASEIVCRDASETSNSNNRGISMYKSAESTLDVIDSTVTASHYALMLNSPGLKVNIKNSTLTGYCAIDVQNDGAVATIEGSTLTGRTFWSSEGENDYQAVVLYNATNAVVNIKTSTIKNEFSGENATSAESLISSNNHNNLVTIDGATQLINVDAAKAPYKIIISYTDQVTIDGVELNTPPMVELVRGEGDSLTMRATVGAGYEITQCVWAPMIDEGYQESLNDMSEEVTLQASDIGDAWTHMSVDVILNYQNGLARVRTEAIVSIPPKNAKV